MTSVSIFWYGLGGTLSVVLLAVWIFRSLTVQVDEGSLKFVIVLGKLTRQLTTPGLYWAPERIWPWTSILAVSNQLDFRTYKGIQVNDHFGTTIVVDLFLEFRITDPYRALFSVENWEDVLRSTVVHSTGSILCGQTIEQILKQRSELAEQLQRQIALETDRWGIRLHGAMIQNIGVLPEVAKQLIRTVGARIERTQALIEEQGRLRVRQLEAETDLQVAELRATAESQSPIEIGKFFRELAKNPHLHKSFAQFWQLSCLEPRRTVNFLGFEESALQALEASSQLREPPEVPARV